MDKLLLFQGKSEKGIFTHVIDAERQYLEKTAAEYNPTIAEYIHNAKPIKGKTQILLTALGAGEYWGDNANADWFGEPMLAHEGTDYGHKTFQHYAHVFKHHVNKDPTASYGTVPLSVYNPSFHRVELIVAIDNARSPDMIDRIERGDYPDWSMGCRVPYDVCNNCGNRAPTRKQYCECMRMYPGRMHPETGRKCFVKNPFAKFFDISEVLIGADRIAKTLQKVASATAVYFGVSSALLAEKMAESAKAATIEKEVPPNQPPASIEAVRTLTKSIPEIKSREASLPKELLNQLGNARLPSALSTLAMLGILPKPPEFQRIVMISFGRGADADQLDAAGECFDPASEFPEAPALDSLAGLRAENFHPGLFELLAPYLASRSYAAPHLGRRLVGLKKNACQVPLPRLIKLGNDMPKDERKPLGMVQVMGIAAALYALFARNAPKEAVRGIDALAAKHPGVAAALGLGLYTAFSHGLRMGAGASRLKGNFNPGESYHNPDATDVFSEIEQQRNKPYAKVASMGAAASRLFVGVPAAYLASGILQKHREMSPHDEESRVKAFIRKNPDVVSGIAVADAMLALRGKGTTALASKTRDFFKKAQDLATEEYGPTPFLKSASAGDFLTSPAVSTLGQLDFPERVVGSLFDQAALEVSATYLT